MTDALKTELSAISDRLMSLGTDLAGNGAIHLGTAQSKELFDISDKLDLLICFTKAVAA